MNKKLIFSMALSLVLVSGSLFSAQANCGLNPCGWRFPSLCGSRDTDKRDLDKPAFSNQEKMDKEQAVYYNTYYD